MSIDARRQRMERIRVISERLHQVAKEYDKLVTVCEIPKSSDVFLELTDSVGTMLLASIQQIGSELAPLARELRKDLQP